MKCFVWLFVFVFVVGLVCAAGEWGDINSGDGFGEGVGLVVNDSEDVVVDNFSGIVNGDEGGSFEYTDNFYIALGLGGFGVLIVIYFIYLFFRKPRNKWKA